MPRIQRKGPTKRGSWRDGLSLAQIFDLAGCGSPAFGADDERRAAWEWWREPFLAGEFTNKRPGHRPAAWWDYDAAEPRPSPRPPRSRELPTPWSPEALRLAELGRLTDEEFEALAAAARLHTAPDRRFWPAERLESFHEEVASMRGDAAWRG